MNSENSEELRRIVSSKNSGSEKKKLWEGDEIVMWLRNSGNSKNNDVNTSDGTSDTTNF